MLDLKTIKNACGLITIVNERGFMTLATGYLVSENYVATCAHVVENVEVGNIDIDFGGDNKKVRHVRINKESDCAVLTLSESTVNITPLRLGECEWKAAWNSYGYPALAKGSGLTMSGIVSDPDARDDLKASVLELTSPEVAAGMAAPIHGFSGSPVIVNDVVVGHLKRFLSDPANPANPAYGKVYATRSKCVHDLLLENSISDSSLDQLVSSPPSPVKPPEPGSEEYSSQYLKIHQLFNEWSTKDMPMGKAGLVASESFIQLGEPKEALKVLSAVPKGLRNEQLRALALAKIDTPDTLNESMQILEKLNQEGHFDAETGKLLGGQYKKMWEISGDSDHLQKSHNIYLNTYKKTRDTNPGINAAATALWLKDKPTSEKIAQEIINKMNHVSLESNDGWALATKGEAMLLTGDLENAKKWYTQAVKRFDYDDKGAVKIMQSQAQRNLKALVLNKNAMENIFIDTKK